MSAIEAATVRCQTMADGTLRLTLDIDPMNALAAFQLFGVPGRAVGIAALKDARGQVHSLIDPKPARPMTEVQQAKWSELGTLCKAAVAFCSHTDFQDWLGVDNAQQAGDRVKEICDIESRKQLDVDEEAADRFRQKVIVPYQKYMVARG